MSIQSPPELVLPTYRIFRYTDGIYKIVKFKRRTGYFKVLCKRSEQPKHDHKLDPSISRSKRVVLELALCNHWEYFCTFTLDQVKYDRYDFKKWHKDFLQWIRDQRKKNLDIKYLLVPELHKDGAWHMHGFFSGIGSELVSFATERKSGRKVTNYLVNNGYYDWPAYRKKFGFCSFGLVRHAVAAAFYVTKYISKNLDNPSVGVGNHQYIPSRGLERSTVRAEVYRDSQYLDQFLENDYQFCKTGMTKLRDALNWTFGLEYADFDPLFESDPAINIEKICDEFYKVVQMSFDDLEVK